MGKFMLLTNISFDYDGAGRKTWLRLSSLDTKMSVFHIKVTFGWPVIIGIAEGRKRVPMLILLLFTACILCQKLTQRWHNVNSLIYFFIRSIIHTTVLVSGLDWKHFHQFAKCGSNRNKALFFSRCPERLAIGCTLSIKLILRINSITYHTFLCAQFPFWGTGFVGCQKAQGHTEGRMVIQSVIKNHPAKLKHLMNDRWRI